MTASRPERLKVLLVDDQPGKLLSYEAILSDLDEELIKARSGAEALEVLLKNDVAVMLVDVSMPELDGFQLAEMIRSHPRFEKLAIIFVSAIHLSEEDVLHGYELGAVDYVPVPIVPALLKAKVNTFLELHRKTRALERLNAELEERVACRTKELEAASRRQELLAREVDHRARNALAMVQAIVSLAKAEDVPSFTEAVLGRIRSMARAHQLLSRSRWRGADLHRVVREELAPYCDVERASISGPHVLLSPAAAQMIALAVHELTTNAVKHGALSNGEGRVDLTWTLDDDDLRLEWRELGGPVASPPEGRGFGMTVIESSFSAQLQGHVELQWRDHGLLCAAILPRRAIAARDPDPPTAPRETADEGEEPAAALAGGRVLLVEDETLIALDLSHMLESMGLEVVGPLHTLDAAMHEPVDRVDVAVLDVNVAGQEVYPLSDTLISKRIPVVFLTGYGRDAVREARSAAAVLQKPVQATELRETLVKVLDEQLNASKRD